MRTPRAPSYKQLSKLARPVQKAAKLRFIRLMSNNVVNNLQLGEQAQIEVKYSLQLESGYNRAGGSFVARITLNSAGYRRDHGRENEIAFRCVPEYELQYDLPQNAKLTNKQVHAFAQVHAPRDAWPYLRESIQMSTVSMALPPFVLPPYDPEPFWARRPISRTEQKEIQSAP